MAVSDPTSPPPGVTDPTLLALLGGPMQPSMPSLGSAVAMQMSPVDEWRSALPVWARDLQLVDLNQSDPRGGPPDLFVWMKDTTRTTLEAPNPTEFDTPQGLRTGGREAETISTSKAQTFDAALHRPYTWDDEDITAAITRMNEAGLPVKNFEDMVQVWEGLVDRAAKTYTYSEGEKKVTPWDVLDMVSQEIAAGGSGDSGPVTTTSTSRSVMEIDEADAWAAMRGTVSQMLGRDPTQRELRDFAYRMNRAAAKNPTISTTTTTKDGDHVSSNTRTKSGFGAEDLAQSAYEEAQADPNYAEYQAASTYFNATMSALGAIGG